MYHGSSSCPAPMIAAVIRERLQQRRRCIYFDSKPMVAGLQADLAQIGVDVAREIARNSLIFSSHLGHLRDDHTFDIEEMIATLEGSLNQALRDGYAGLWASGDVAWEFGPKGDFGQLVQYETRLEDFVSTHAEFSGICLYDASVLPPDAMQNGHELHPSLFISETQSRLNPAYRPGNQGRSATLPQDTLKVSLPRDIFLRASACADSEGTTLNEFISRAISEKLYPPDPKNLKN